MNNKKKTHHTSSIISVKSTIVYISCYFGLHRQLHVFRNIKQLHHFVANERQTNRLQLATQSFLYVDG